MTHLDRLAAALDFEDNYEEHIGLAATQLLERISGYGRERPRVAITLGSGLGDVAAQIEDCVQIPYKEITNFPVPIAEGHEGVFHVGRIADVPVLALQGRTHFYDTMSGFGNGMLKTVFPVHVLGNMGVETYFATNAAGGLRLSQTLKGMQPAYKPGDVMIITSHIHAMPNPLAGRPLAVRRIDQKPIERFQPMNDAYDPALVAMLRTAGAEYPGHVHEGTYFGTTGPSYETRGETEMMRILKADAVGMSTTPEVIVARNLGMRAVGFSCITNVIDADGNNAATHGEVLGIANDPVVRARLAGFTTGFFEQYRQQL